MRSFFVFLQVVYWCYHMYEMLAGRPIMSTFLKPEGNTRDTFEWDSYVIILHRLPEIPVEFTTF